MKSKQQKRIEAQQRDAARAKRSDRDQLAKIEAAGHGHSREAIRLRKKIAEQQTAEKTSGGTVKVKKNYMGFTLVEVLIAICIIAVLLAIIVPILRNGQ